MEQMETDDIGSTDPHELARNHYENFPLATMFMPSDLRPHVRRLYAFARTVDDLGDEAEGDRRALLDQWTSDFKRCYAGTPEHPILRELQQTIEAFDLPSDLFLRLIEANRRDQSVKRYETFDELLDYCTYSATPCGRLFLRVCGHESEELMQLADCTCTALQLTNFWQDVGDDLDRDRVYIPQEDLRAYDLTVDDLYSFSAGEEPPESFYELMAFQVRRTRIFFGKGMELLQHLTTCSFDVLLFTVGGVSVLEKLERQKFPVFDRRVTITGLARAGIFIKAAWLYLTGTVDRYRKNLLEKACRED